MTVRNVVKVTDPEGKRQLSLLSVPVKTEEFDTPELRALVADMLDTMRATKGVGIAARQIGDDRSLIIIGFDDENERYKGEKPVPVTLIINPVIEPVFEEGKEEGEEGCLSVPGVRGLVSRYKTVLCKGYDIKGNKIEFKFSGFGARIAQHEGDHLKGKLFVQRVEEQKGELYATPISPPSNDSVQQ